jgi:hypothetical protein
MLLSRPKVQELQYEHRHTPIPQEAVADQSAENLRTFLN